MVNVKCPVCSAPLAFPGLVERDAEAAQLLRECYEGWVKGDDVAGPMRRAATYLDKYGPDKELLQWHPSFGVGEPGWQAWVTDVMNTLIRERNGPAHE